MLDDSSTHWQSVYQTKPSDNVSWYRPHLDLSLTLLKQAGLNQASRVIDIGAGASTLVDDLLDLGVQQLTALDISAASLEISKRRLGSRADKVSWMVEDAAHHAFAANSFDIWHDRAVLHFLANADDATAYVANASNAIVAGGYAVIACFASDGPERCSGLPVVRREPDEIAALFGNDFTLVYSTHEKHVTPWGAPQSFAYALLRKDKA